MKSEEEFSEETIKNLIRMGLVETQKDNPDNIKITFKGFSQIVQFKRDNPEMTALLFMQSMNYLERQNKREKKKK